MPPDCWYAIRGGTASTDAYGERHDAEHSQVLPENSAFGAIREPQPGNQIQNSLRVEYYHVEVGVEGWGDASCFRGCSRSVSHGSGSLSTRQHQTAGHKLHEYP